MLQRAAASSLPRARSNRRGGGGAILPCFQAHPVSVRSRTSSSSSISSGECDAPVAGTYYRSSHVDCRGRLSTFATVVVNADKGRSASPVWSHACSLLETNAPTLAVAFVSKHTPSSAAAMEEFGSAFGSSIDGGGNDPKLTPFIGCVADVWNVAATTTTTTPGGDDKRKKLVSSSSSSSARASGDDGRSLTGSQGCVMLRADAELSDDDTVEEFKALVVDCARWTRENPGVVADSDDLVALDKKIGLSEMKNNDLVACDRKVNEETKVPDEGYERKTGVNEPKSRELALEREENGMPVVKIEAYSSESKNTDVVPGIVSAAAEITADGGGGVVSPQGGVVTSGGSANQSVSGSDESVVTEDDDYRMILCVANLPGIKATSFHTTTTGLPTLPDMETAVVRSNPHMLLLGAPGYPYPEFVQRLSVMFPESCRLQSRRILVSAVL